jgi:hypothetical protein
VVKKYVGPPARRDVEDMLALGGRLLPRPLARVEATSRSWSILQLDGYRSAAAPAVVNGAPYGLTAYDSSGLRSREMPARVDRERIAESEAGEALSTSTTFAMQRSLAFRTRKGESPANAFARHDGLKGQTTSRRNPEGLVSGLGRGARGQPAVRRLRRRIGFRLEPRNDAVARRLLVGKG